MGCKRGRNTGLILTVEHMTKLLIDFKDTISSDQYPSHGWARNSQGLKLLWLPIVRNVCQLAVPIASNSQNRSRDLSVDQILEIKAFHVTLEKLVLTLRYLSNFMECGKEPAIHAPSNAEFNLRMEAVNTVPLFVDLAFVYLRRLADDFARASRFVCFRYADNAPRKFKQLRKHVCNGDLDDLLVNPDMMQEAFNNCAGWFDSLNARPEAAETRRGIRSSIEHHPVFISAQHSKDGDEPWQLEVSLGWPGQKEYVRDVVSILRQIISELCRFWTVMCRAISTDNEYIKWICPYGDQLGGITGNDENITNFWPKLGDS